MKAPRNPSWVAVKDAIEYRLDQTDWSYTKLAGRFADLGIETDDSQLNGIVLYGRATRDPGKRDRIIEGLEVFLGFAEGELVALYREALSEPADLVARRRVRTIGVSLDLHVSNSVTRTYERISIQALCDDPEEYRVFSDANTSTDPDNPSVRFEEEAGCRLKEVVATGPNDLQATFLLPKMKRDSTGVLVIRRTYVGGLSSPVFTFAPSFSVDFYNIDLHVDEDLLPAKAFKIDGLRPTQREYEAAWGEATTLSETGHFSARFTRLVPGFCYGTAWKERYTSTASA